MRLEFKHAAAYLACAAVLACTPSVRAIALEQVDTPAPDDRPVDHALVDLHSPLSTAQGFMRAAETGDYRTAATYLDLRNLPRTRPPPTGEQLAEQFYIVLSRRSEVNFDALSDSPDGIAEDNLPVNLDLLGRIVTREGGQSLYLKRLPGPNGVHTWKIADTTVARIPQLYAEQAYSPLVEAVRKHSPHGSFLGAEWFKWIIAVLVGLAAVLACRIVAWPLSRILTRRSVSSRERVQRYLNGPVAAAVFVGLGAFVMNSLGLGLTASRIARSGTLITAVTIWLLFATIDLLRDLYARHLQARGRDSGLILLRPATATAKVLLVVIAVVVWLENTGISVTGMIAGLGVGGIAVALAVQKPLEDIIGAFNLYAQQPVRIGQFCRTGDVTGTIEEIGLRTTRIRKLDDKLVVVPNSVFATASIENYSERRRILHCQTVRLALDTGTDKVKVVLEKLRDVLTSHPRVATGAWRVRFVEFGEFSINLEVFAHVATTDWPAFLAVAEEINLRTLEAVESAGARLAMPPR
jgi:MscS family membrane protein